MGSVLFYMTSGLVLGWSLGANDAANVFGTAVGSRMLRFITAAWICSVFVVLGAVLGGAGAARGLGQLGAVNALAGSFTVALSAALTVYWMTRLGLPVSTTQAIVGGIVGWNLYSGFPTDLAALGRIVGTWVACPVLAALFAMILYRLCALLLRWFHPHLLTRDWLIRWGLILAGAFGAYSLGANNIANVMGVFVASNPFAAVTVGPGLVITGTQQLFFLGALAIAAGVFTYSRRVMMTVGANLLPLNPLGAWIVVVAHSLVLFVFSSVALQHAAGQVGLYIPLIPVSSSQAVIGAVLGVALVQAGGRAVRQVRWRVLLTVASGWVTTPVATALVCYVSLFVVQNVFQEQVYARAAYVLTPAALQRLQQQGISVQPLDDLTSRPIAGAVAFRNELRHRVWLGRRREARVLQAAELHPMTVSAQRLQQVDRRRLTVEQLEALRRLLGNTYQHRWQLAEALTRLAPAWRAGSAAANSRQAQQINQALDHLYEVMGDAPAP